MRAWRPQAARSQDLVERYVNGKAAQDRELNTKVAALLNSKKKKLREMRQQLEEAQVREAALGGWVHAWVRGWAGGRVGGWWHVHCFVAGCSKRARASWQAMVVAV